MKPFLRKYGMTILSGALLAFSFPNWRLYPLAWLALVPLFWDAARLTPRQAAGRFMLAGWVFHSLLLQWLITNIYWGGGFAVLGYQLLCVILALFWGAMGYIWIEIRRRTPALGGAVALPVLWVTMEFLQSRIFTGFGWSAIGYSQGADLPVLQLASLGGVHLVSAVLVLANALIAEALLARSRARIVRIAAALGVVAACHAVGYTLLRPAQYPSVPMKIGIFQSDFPLEMKYDWEYTLDMLRNAADKSRAMAARADLDLIVWPEALVMGDMDDPAVMDLVAKSARDTGAFLYTGSVRGDYNSSHLIAPDGTIAGHYDKMHLAPFGEYVPFGDQLPFLRQVVPTLGDIAFGDGQRTLPIHDRRMGPLICFEVLFSNLSEHLRGLGADFLVVITNLGWFGSSNAIPQELEIARMRAAETRLPLVHSANTGITGVFDPYGRFTMANGIFTRSGEMLFLTRELNQGDVIMQRMGGIFDLPEPAPRLVPALPWLFPWLMLGAYAALIAAAACRPRRPPATT